MKREDIKAMLPILQAFADGKVIQMLDNRSIRTDLTEREGLPIGTLRAESNSFRIKPEQKYRPFANAEECWQEMLKHQPFGWVKDTEANEYLNVYCISNSASSIDLFGRMFKRCIFIDGSPYGIKVEE